VRRLGIIVAAGIVTAVLFGWFLVVKLPSWFVPKAAVVPPPAVTAETAVRKIRARLFYVSEDGMRLVGVERDVPFGETPPEQAQALIEEQLKPAPAPLLAPLPASTSLRSIFVTQTGEAYVDLSKDVVTAHTGGSLDELFSVYAIVNTLTVNLPAITRVQILVDGKEADSLAGHIDVRGPLPRSDRWAIAPQAAVPAAASPDEAPAAPASPPAALPTTAPSKPAAPGTVPGKPAQPKAPQGPTSPGPPAR
jgi:hypothetical protein